LYTRRQLACDVISPPQSWYEPPEPRQCCALYEEADHDNDACHAEQAEAAAERAADRAYDEMQWRGWDE
jgi:hypothetical protein